MFNVSMNKDIIYMSDYSEVFRQHLLTQLLWPMCTLHKLIYLHVKHGITPGLILQHISFKS